MPAYEELVTKSSDQRPAELRIRRCPNARCRSKTGLEIIAASFRAEGIRIVNGRWDVRTATSVATDDEVVRCLDCGHVFPLTEILL